QRMDSLDKQGKENEAIKENLNRQIEVVNHKRTELEKHQEEHIRRLEKIAALTADEARNQLIESLKNEAQTRALALQQEIIDDARQKANKEARKIIIQSIQRTAAEQAIENSITVFNLESEEIVEKTRKQIEEQVMEIGERTVIELGIHGLHKELVRIVGKMRFRSSYGQNL